MSDFKTLDLSGFFNHKAVVGQHELGRVPNPDAQGLELQDFLLASDLPDSLQEVLINGVPFVFPDKSFDKFDNLCCEGQKIETLKASYSRLHILGCSEFGDFREKMGLVFEDGSCCESDTYFVYVYSKEWKVDESRNSKFGLECKTGRNNLMYISHSVCEISGEGRMLKMIELPDNSFIHIFAATLEK